MVNGMMLDGGWKVDGEWKWMLDEGWWWMLDVRWMVV